MVKLLIFLGFIVSITVLQIKLSLNKNKWYGLIIPVFLLLAGLVFTPVKMENGRFNTEDVFAIIFSLIPFIINLIIYFACRSKLKDKTRSEIDMMKIKDL